MAACGPSSSASGMGAPSLRRPLGASRTRTRSPGLNASAERLRPLGVAQSRRSKSTTPSPAPGSTSSLPSRAAGRARSCSTMASMISESLSAAVVGLVQHFAVLFQGVAGQVAERSAVTLARVQLLEPALERLCVPVLESAVDGGLHRRPALECALLAVAFDQRGGGLIDGLRRQPARRGRLRHQLDRLGPPRGRRFCRST